MRGNWIGCRLMPLSHLSEERCSQYLADPENVFVISSDFCHWGKRFRFTPFSDKGAEIHKSIEHLDRRDPPSHLLLSLKPPPCPAPLLQHFSHAGKAWLWWRHKMRRASLLTSESTATPSADSTLSQCCYMRCRWAHHSLSREGRV